MKKEYQAIDFEYVERLVYYNFQNRRSYAPFFDWKNPDNPGLGKKVKERGVVCDLVKSLEKDAGQELFSVVKYGEDPPDCVAIDTGGEAVGFEVTELVDEQTVKARSKGVCEHKEWKAGEFIAKIKEILHSKSKKLRSSSFTRNILIIHTDEPDLRFNFDQCEMELNACPFLKPSHIDEAFLLFSYRPGRETYPYLRIKL